MRGKQLIIATILTSIVTTVQAGPISTAENCLPPVAAVGFFLSKYPHYEMDGLTGRKVRIGVAALVDIIVFEKYESVPGDANWQRLKGAVTDSIIKQPAFRGAYDQIKRNVRNDDHPFAGDKELRTSLSKCLNFAYERRSKIQDFAQ